jgi:hypothetical protein
MSIVKNIYKFLLRVIVYKKLCFCLVKNFLYNQYVFYNMYKQKYNDR